MGNVSQRGRGGGGPRCCNIIYRNQTILLDLPYADPQAAGHMREAAMIDMGTLLPNIGRTSADP